MNPQTKRNLTMAIVVVLVAALVWFLYPRSFAQAMGRTFDRENTCTVQAVLRKGGSSMITNYMAIGVLLSISTRRQRGFFSD